MKIGFLGASTAAQTIARHVLPFGHQVMLSNTRGAESLAPLCEKLGASWLQVQTAPATVPDWKGRVLVDTTNRLASLQSISTGRHFRPHLERDRRGPRAGRRGREAFNSVPMAWIADTSSSKPRTVLFLSGDDAQAKKPIAELIEQVGLTAVDLGSLAVSGRLQQLGGPLTAIRF